MRRNLFFKYINNKTNVKHKPARNYRNTIKNVSKAGDIKQGVYKNEEMKM